jgi:hypothetical protein
MSKPLVTLALMCASLQAQVTGASNAVNAEPSAISSAAPVNPVIEWNRTLLVILQNCRRPASHHSFDSQLRHTACFHL